MANCASGAIIITGDETMITELHNRITRLPDIIKNRKSGSDPTYLTEILRDTTGMEEVFLDRLRQTATDRIDLDYHCKGDSGYDFFALIVHELGLYGEMFYMNDCCDDEFSVHIHTVEFDDDHEPMRNLKKLLMDLPD